MSYHRRELRVVRFLALVLFAVGISLAVGAVFMSARRIDPLGRIGLGVSGTIFATLAGMLSIGLRRLGGEPSELHSSDPEDETGGGERRKRYSWQEFELAEKAALGFVGFGSILIFVQVFHPVFWFFREPIVLEGFGTTGAILIALGLILRARVRKFSIVPGDRADSPPHQTWHGSSFESADANDARRNDPGSLGGIY